ncbi:MAG: hypothetical protein HC862_06860 [Scytonema sp. RU_4_4]|nr:hypothetical protein [Scytonema sp. RU_4_4]NJR74990.1 hypothetical protein [Scytonema sp. CRU_2_7]
MHSVYPEISSLFSYSGFHPGEVQIYLRTLREAAKERLYLRLSAVS